MTKEFLDHYDIQDAVQSVAAGIELHRYQFCFKPSFQELIILNGIHAGLVVGEEREFERGMDLSLEGVGVFVNETLVASGIGHKLWQEDPYNI